MEFAKTSLASSSNTFEMLPVSASGSILSPGNIAINDMENNVVNIGLSSFYSEGVTLQPTDSTNLCKASNGMPLPIYLLAAAPTDEQSTSTSSTNLELLQNTVVPVSNVKSVDHFTGTITVPLTYYSAFTPNQPQLFSIINKPNNDSSSNQNKVILSTKENQLSEDFVRSFVVDGSKKSNTTTDSFAQSEQSSKPSNQNHYVPKIDCSVQTSEDFFDEQNEEKMDTDENNVIKKSLEKEKSNSNNLSANALDAEDQPLLLMNSRVEKELFDSSGISHGREVSTQTTPLPKPNGNTKKSKESLDDTQPPITPAFKVILTTDDPNFEMGASFSDSSSSNVADDKEFKCPRCTRTFARKSILDVHLRCHSENYDDKRFICYICGMIHHQWIKMYNHLFTHGVNKPYHCDQCTYSCTSKCDLENHAYVHIENKVWRCPKCDRSFKHQRNMKAHARNCLGLDGFGKPIRSESNEFQCHICQKRLRNKRNLDKHMEIHTDLKPFVCNICGHATRLKESLLTHKRIHTGEKPFKCDVCSYSSSDKSSLRRHKRKHTNEKPYSCKFCDYKSIQKHCLDMHVHRKHTGEKFVCGLCHYETFHRYSLNQHFKQQHQQEIEQSSEETCLVSVAPGVVISNNSEESGSSGSLYIGIPSSSENTIMTDAAKPTDVTGDIVDVVSTEDVLNNLREANLTTSESVVQSATEQSGVDLVQHIQQPGDVVYLQENGNIFIKKQDGNVLIIQQVEEAEAANTLS